MKGKEQIEQMCKNMTTMSGVACTVIDEHNQVLFHSTDNSASVCMEDSLRVGRHLYQRENGEQFLALRLQAEENYRLFVGPFVLENNRRI